MGVKSRGLIPGVLQLRLHIAHLHKMRLFIIPLLTLSALAGEVREDWARVTALDAGPGVQPQTADEARQLSLAHLEKQERALREYMTAHTGDENACNARLRLSRLLGLRAELKGEAEPAEAARLLNDAQVLASTPAQQTDVDFARVAERMRRLRGKRPGVIEREGLLDAAQDFQRKHGDDHRLGVMLAEVSRLFDSQPKKKETLLRDAQKLTKDPGTLAQIADDLKRLSIFEKVLPLRFTALDGKRVDAKDWRGRPVIVVFFATWSAPSKKAFADLRRDSAGAEFIGISLDSDRRQLDAFLSEQNVKSSIAWDGKGWDSPLVQALGINALPTMWLLDKDGVLRSLDALEDTAGQLKKLAR